MSPANWNRIKPGRILEALLFTHCFLAASFAASVISHLHKILNFFSPW
jgi:hypothetical protein